MRGHVRQRGRNWAVVIDVRDPDYLLMECTINYNSLKRSRHP
jgi:hypothetical protein